MQDALKNDKIHRKVHFELAVVVDILANIAVCEAVPFASASGGGFSVPTGETYVTLTFYVSLDGVTYTQLFDKANAAISRTVAAGRSYPLPEELFGFPLFKVVGNVAGNLQITLKA